MKPSMLKLDGDCNALLAPVSEPEPPPVPVPAPVPAPLRRCSSSNGPMFGTKTSSSIVVDRLLVMRTT